MFLACKSDRVEISSTLEELGGSHDESSNMVFKYLRELTLHLYAKNLELAVNESRRV